MEKYATLKDLRDAYAAGTVTDPLMIDNDDTFVYQDDETVFESRHPDELLEQALDLLGIPHEHV